MKGIARLLFRTKEPKMPDEMVMSALNLLGKKARDKVSGYAGAVSSLSFDLYGCIQVALSPPVNNEGRHEAGHWFDIARIVVTDHDRVMPVPEWRAVARHPEGYNHGASDKPPYGETAKP